MRDAEVGEEMVAAMQKTANTWRTNLETMRKAFEAKLIENTGLGDADTFNSWLDEQDKTMESAKKQNLYVKRITAPAPKAKAKAEPTQRRKPAQKVK
jgi:U3 small nucleolar RNA-associated protein 14